MKTSDFKNFQEFYPFYLHEHSNHICRTLHFIGTALVICITLIILTIREFQLVWLIPIVGYGFAWIGHFVFEKNRPATFKYPLYSFTADFVMFWQLLTGQLEFHSKEK
jgi:hypothetical protein